MRAPALRLQRRALLGAQAQRGAIIDRRPAERLLALAPAVEFLGRLVGGIEPARLAQLRRGGVIKRHALGLAAVKSRARCRARRDRLDRIGIFDARALAIGVVEAQDEAAALDASRRAS